MAEITAKLVKDLREVTGAGMMDCKKALAAVDGDMDKAIDFLREKGLAGAQKKAGRIAAEGMVDAKLCPCGTKGVVVEVNSETDFVAKNEKFRNYVADVAQQALEEKTDDIEAFLASPWKLDPSMTVAEKLSSMISIIGENMHIRRFHVMEEPEGLVESYIHGGGKIGVLLALETDKVNDEIREMAKNVCMQIAALRPLYTNADEVSADYIEKEKEILKAQIMNDPKESQKPEKVIDGMIAGRVAKELKEIVLADQVYVKAEDGKQSVKDYVASVAKKNDAKIRLKNFVRFETGEGLEKRNDDFAAEVAAQMNK